MLYVGMDVGALYTKAVVLRGAEQVSSAMASTGERCDETAERVLREALAPLGASSDDIAGLAATGAGKQEVRGARTRPTEILCAVAGAKRVCPEARGLVDLGAESTRVVELDDQNQVRDFALNDKCAAGTGIFLDAMGEVMGVPVAEMGPLSLESTTAVDITNTCVVFAESEVVSQIHRGTPAPDILRGLHRAISTRVFSQLSRVKLAGKVLVFGGLAQNVGIVGFLNELVGERKLAAELLVPAEPQFVSALGAAYIAAAEEAP
jgi:predicted CoA-substrate-specific enzyme activase